MLQRTPRRGWGRRPDGPDGSSAVRLFLIGLLDMAGVAAFAFGEGSAITGRADAMAIAVVGVSLVILGCVLVWRSGT